MVAAQLAGPRSTSTSTRSPKSEVESRKQRKLSKKIVLGWMDGSWMRLDGPVSAKKKNEIRKRNPKKDAARGRGFWSYMRRQQRGTTRALDARAALAAAESSERAARESLQPFRFCRDSVSKQGISYVYLGKIKAYQNAIAKWDFVGGQEFHNLL